jgi:hypothetical protein
MFSSILAAILLVGLVHLLIQLIQTIVTALETIPVPVEAHHRVAYRTCIMVFRTLKKSMIASLYVVFALLSFHVCVALVRVFLAGVTVLDFFHALMSKYWITTCFTFLSFSAEFMLPYLRPVAGIALIAVYRAGEFIMDHHIRLLRLCLEIFVFALECLVGILYFMTEHVIFRSRFLVLRAVNSLYDLVDFLRYIVQQL